MAKQAASSAFGSAMKKVPTKAWQKAKTVEPGGGGFSLPDIEDGSYPVHVSGGRCGVGDKGKMKGIPYIAVTLTVDEPENYKGVKLDKFHSLKDMEKDLAAIVKTFKGLGYQFDDSFSPDQLEALVADAVESKASGVCSVKNATYKNADGEDVATINIYMNKPAEESAPAAPKRRAKK